MKRVPYLLGLARFLCGKFTGVWALKGFAIVALLAIGMKSAGAQKDPQVEAMMAAAQQKATIEGDLNAAIQQYKTIADKYAKTDRNSAATALLRVAELYQRLGDAEAQKTYQRIARDFPEQKEQVALAQARLWNVAAGAKTERAVWTGSIISPPPGSQFMSRVSSDGNSILYMELGTGRLMLHDVASKADRALTESWMMDAFISRDGKHVVYWDLPEGQRQYRLRIAPLPKTGVVEARDVLQTDDWLHLTDWSPDGNSILAAIRPKNNDSVQIAVIALADGSIRVVKTLEDWWPQMMFFSPDGQYIAYDFAAKGSSQSDVFVLPVQGGTERRVIAHAADEHVMGWSPDGAWLLFSSDRTLSRGLWAVPFAAGAPKGEPVAIKSDIGSSVPLGVTSSGAIYVLRGTTDRDVAIAPIDYQTGKLLASPIKFPQGYVGDPQNLSWSPDEKYLAYPVLSCDNNCNIAIRSVDTGEVRRLPRMLKGVDSAHLAWSPDGRSLLTKATDLTGRTGIFQIDVASGEPKLVLRDNVAGYTQWSPDGKKIYFTRYTPALPVLVERDLQTGSERVVNTARSRVAGIVSPDGQYFFAPNSETILVVGGVAGGERRELLRLAPGEIVAPHQQWTPDSRAILIVKIDGSRKELWEVPINGDQPRKLDINPDIWMEGSARPGFGDQGFIPSPKGGRIAFMMGKSTDEVWVLENFLPKQRK
jgi:Tol biopolymer transport system component